jgi:hypothetical protein
MVSSALSKEDTKSLYWVTVESVYHLWDAVENREIKGIPDISNTQKMGLAAVLFAILYGV